MTAAIPLYDLTELMIDAAARTFNPGIRHYGETDAVLYGKVCHLNSLAEPLHSTNLTESEEHFLLFADKELLRAFNHLSAIIFP